LEPRRSDPRKNHGGKETIRMLVRFNDEDFPFCSDRCRKIDLGKWATGVYKISSPILDPEVLEDLGELGGSRGGDSHDD
jgi:endogenous inhibitor of DNA gyrase (YacG/DUF329 family)